MSDKEKTETPDYGSMAGEGFENQTMADIKIPFLGILQALSPELSPKNAKFLKDAKAGDLFNTVTGEFWDGDEGIVIQPCDTSHKCVEWRPRTAGGGLVDIHETDDPIVEAAKRDRELRKSAGPQDEKEARKLKTPAGTELVDTFYIYAHLLTEANGEIISPIVVSCSSTKITPYRMLMSRLRTIKFRPPLFAFQIRVKTKEETNSQNQPYHNFKFEAAIDNNLMQSLIPPADPQQLLEEGATLMLQQRQGLLAGRIDAAAAATSDTEATPEAF